MTHYNTDHLTTEEIRQVAQAVWAQLQDSYRIKEPGGPVPDAVLEASSEELHEEYQFWAQELERRVGA